MLGVDGCQVGGQDTKRPRLLNLDQNTGMILTDNLNPLESLQNRKS